MDNGHLRVEYSARSVLNPVFWGGGEPGVDAVGGDFGDGGRTSVE